MAKLSSINKNNNRIKLSDKFFITLIYPNFFDEPA